MKKDKDKILETLFQTDKLYLKTSGGMCEEAYKDEGKVDFFALYKVDEITFEDKAPRKEALENVISSMNIEGVNFIYIIKGNRSGVNFYYGVARDFEAEPPMGIYDIGTHILKPSLQGNFRGSKISEVSVDGKKALLAEIDMLKKTKVLEGVPGINKDDEGFQAVDRIIDVMLGNEFAIMLIAKPLLQEEIVITQEKMYNLYNSIAPLAKSSEQESIGKSEGSSTTKTKSESTTTGTSSSATKQEGRTESKSIATGTSNGTNKSTTQGTNKEETKGNDRKTTTTISGQEGTSEGKSTTDTTGTSESTSDSTTMGNSSSNTVGSSDAISKNIGTNTGKAVTLEFVNKKVQDWIKYIDEVVLPRIDYGRGKGLFLASTVLMGNEEAELIKLENTIRSIYGGEVGNRMPLKAYEVDSKEVSFLKRMQLPSLTFEKEILENEADIRIAYSQLMSDSKKAKLGNWMSSKELSLIAGLPQKEVVGLALREEVEFGLNIAKEVKEPVLLGYLIQSGIELSGESGTPKIEVNFERDYFDKHIFVTGTTGSGKTTTCQKLLLESNEDFMVIEPAKTEYRILTKKFPDMLVFTLGKETGAPFRLNPFEFFKGESITSRVDMIKASMEAAFDMEAAIPQVLEAAMYQCYENKGWDISTNKNRYFDDPFADGIFAFPTLSDLDNEIEKVIVEQGFEDRLKSEYIGSIRARLKGLLVGAKGLMLDTPRSIDFVELLGRKVVLELENIKSVSEKSLIMGFILANLTEAIKEKYSINNKQIQHITLIEEAHRLLSKYMPGDSLNKKQGVEMFSDMLAEVRKYGESLIIADQIPNKLTPEVLKNTNTKIVHKIFAQDDKEAIGNTMALKDEQKKYLSYLEVGNAIMINPGLSKAIQIKIIQDEENNTNRIPPKDEELRERCLEYYSSVYKKGIMPGLECLKKEPTSEQLKIYLEYFQPNSSFMQAYRTMVLNRDTKRKKVVIGALGEISKVLTIEDIVQLVHVCLYDEKQIDGYSNFNTDLKEFLCKLLDKNNDKELEELKKKDILEMVKGGK